MAESQEKFGYGGDVQTNLSRQISPSRLGPYLRLTAVGGDFEQAVKWYLWNARLAKAFLYPLQTVEVAVRNSIHEAFSQFLGGPNWIFNPPFSLTSEHQGALSTARRRLAWKKQNPTSDDLVASLSLDFWSNLFRVEYSALWAVPDLLEAAFPHAPAGADRDRIKKVVRRVNEFRNRVAHHEPIHNVSAHDQLTQIETLTSWVCADTAKWMKNHSTVMKVARTQPTVSSNFSGTPLSAANLRPPPVIDPSNSLAEAIRQIGAARPPLALVQDASKTPPFAMVTLADVATYIERIAGQPGDIIDINEHAVSDLADITSGNELLAIPLDASTGDASELFFPRDKTRPKPAALVVTKPDGTCAGVILKPSMKL